MNFLIFFQDFSLGEHLLLIGSQGTGKNKLTDQFLQKLQIPRQYIQLHRDTTVQSLTVQPSLLVKYFTYIFSLLYFYSKII